jgi:hypothetical protein
MAIIRKTPEEIEKMAAAGQVLVRCHEILRKKARPGVTTAELDEAAERFIRSQGAEPAFKGYRGFPGSICASPNSMVVHGIPGSYRLQRGDLLSVDIGVVLNGTSSVLYATIGDFVDEERIARAFGFFYTLGSLCGIAAPLGYGLIGDLYGVDTSMAIIGVAIFLTVPLAALLRPAQARLRSA